ncbi:ferrous iron transport protein A [Clostridium estertheticum]|uniref:FeoA family protein n=1 Tax=Clostridium estertheticum TaxID=238834 RepID=UPI001C0E4597|nr:FeoA family protein [Clostridium estertheticum]MBU3216534.1 ferrous iron transport protein A [Clostridium estertheticum]WAG54477.1 ferrous iron transport protein A [Clostridium estertheticum]
MNLSEGKIGSRYSIENISLPVKLEKRLQAIGMTIGTKILVLNNKISGSIIIKVRGTRFALGINISKKIRVR